MIGLFDAGGNTVVQYVYNSWGMPVSTTGTKASTVGAINPFRYRGYVYDTESGLYYLQSRYYNPEWGRFVSEDAIIADVGNIEGYNIYQYCSNNPVNVFDPSGYLGISSQKILEQGKGPIRNNHPLIPDPFSSLAVSTSAVVAGQQIVDLGKGYTARIEDGHVPNDQRHVHIFKNGSEVANQNEDGSPHHKNKNKPGEPKKKIKFTLKEKTGWDWDVKRDKFEDEHGLDFTMDPGVQLFLFPGDAYSPSPKVSPRMAPSFSPKFAF